MPHSKTELSIIVPVFNEEATIEQVITDLLRLKLDCEIIIVNNGSTDSTGEKLKRFGDEPRVTLIDHSAEKGKGAAIRAGLAVAKGEYVVIQDGDLEYDTRDITRLLELARSKQADAVFGSRNLNPDSGISYLRYYWGGRLLTWIANQMFSVGITDEATCYKLVRREILQGMKLECVRFEFCPEVVAKLGLMHLRIYEVPIRYYPRSIEEGKKIRWTDGAEAIWTLIKWSLKNPEYILQSDQLHSTQNVSSSEQSEQ